MSDLKRPALLYLKGGLFVLTGLVAAGLLLAESPSLKAALLLAVCVWSFCRAYYFAFYVIEKYIDGQYRFAGLWSFAMYLLRGAPAHRGETASAGLTSTPCDADRSGPA